MKISELIDYVTNDVIDVSCVNNIKGVLQDMLAVNTLSSNLAVMENGFYLLDCSGGNRTFYLSPSSEYVKYKRIDSSSNTCTISSSGSALTFDGQTSFTVRQYEAEQLVRSGTGVYRW